LSSQVLLFLIIFFVGGTIAIGKHFLSWKLSKVSAEIARELRGKGALGPFTAVDLSLPNQRFTLFGLTDYRSMALKYMVEDNIVGKTWQGKFYLLRERF
jgi:hypothetical protein